MEICFKFIWLEVEQPEFELDEQQDQFGYSEIIEQ